MFKNFNLVLRKFSACCLLVQCTRKIVASRWQMWMEQQVPWSLKLKHKKTNQKKLKRVHKNQKKNWNWCTKARLKLMHVCVRWGSSEGSAVQVQCIFGAWSAPTTTKESVWNCDATDVIIPVPCPGICLRDAEWNNNGPACANGAAGSGINSLWPSDRPIGKFIAFTAVWGRSVSFDSRREGAVLTQWKVWVWWYLPQVSGFILYRSTLPAKTKPGSKLLISEVGEIHPAWTCEKDD